mgnify:CR=1 FL=1
MNIIIIHGPNLNMLGKRDAEKYGTRTLDEINNLISQEAKKLGASVSFFQSNHEGAIIDHLQSDEVRNSDGLVINPGALIRYAYSFRQALVDLNKPLVEVHMSDIHKTGVNKKVNIFDDVAQRIDQIAGKKEHSYIEGIQVLIKNIK